MAGEAEELREIKVSAAEGAKVDAPAPTTSPSSAPATSAPVNVSTKVKRDIPEAKPAGRSWHILLPGLLVLTTLLMVLALIRQEVMQWPPSPRLVVVPRGNLPAYHQIQEADLRSQIRFAGRTEAETLKKASDIVGRYTLRALRKDEPIEETQLGPAVNNAQFSGKTAVVVSLPDVTVSNEPLKAGDVVDITFGPPPGQGQQQQSQASPGAPFQNVFVLNVKPPDKSDPAIKDQPVKNYLLILALPLERQAEFEAEIAKEMPLTFRRKQLTR